MGEKKGNLPGKIRDVLVPFAVYYAVFMAAFFLLSCGLQMLAGISGNGVQADDAGTTAAAVRKLLEEHGETVTGIVNGISMLTGAAFLLPMFRAELQMRKSGGHKELYGRSAVAVLSVTVALAAVSSVGFNILLSLTGLVQNSAGYQRVAQNQYGVPFGVGLFLYTVISPLAEEIVFRGVLYNRLLRHFCGSGGLPVSAAIVISGVMFGIYHGNLVQGIYGCCMGILITWLYERTHDFRIPCLFHGVANCAVYLTAQNTVLQEKLFTVPWCALLLVVTVGLLCLLEKTVRRYSENSTKYH